MRCGQGSAQLSPESPGGFHAIPSPKGSDQSLTPGMELEHGLHAHALALGCSPASSRFQHCLDEFRFLYREAGLEQMLQFLGFTAESTP